MPVFDMQLLGECLEPDVGLLDRVIERRYRRVGHDLIIRFAFRRASSQRSHLVTVCALPCLLWAPRPSRLWMMAFCSQLVIPVWRQRHRVGGLIKRRDRSLGANEWL